MVEEVAEAVGVDGELDDGIGDAAPHEEIEQAGGLAVPLPHHAGEGEGREAGDGVGGFGGAALVLFAPVTGEVEGHGRKGDAVGRMAGEPGIMGQEHQQQAAAE